MLGFAPSLGNPPNLGSYPRFYALNNDIFLGSVGDVDCLFVAPKSTVKLPMLLNMVGQLQRDFKTPCVIVSPNLSRYQVGRLCEEGIAPQVIGTQGRKRYIVERRDIAPTELLKAFEPFLSSPVALSVYLKFEGDREDFLAQGCFYAGVTALSMLTIQADDRWTTFATDANLSIGETASHRLALY